MNKKIAVYPGSFDPLTYGHLEIIQRTSKLFDEVIVAVADNLSKKSTFSIKQRLDMISQTTKHLKNVKIKTFKGLLVEFMKKNNAKVIIRGLRAVSDFEYEFQMSLMNRRLYPDIETVFLVPDEKFIFLSSSLVKEVVRLDGDVGEFVPDVVEKQMRKKFKKRGISHSLGKIVKNLD